MRSRKPFGEGNRNRQTDRQTERSRQKDRYIEVQRNSDRKRQRERHREKGRGHLHTGCLKKAEIISPRWLIAEIL
jgi:hypothetical protein